MFDAGSQFRPREISGNEFARSNVFVAWSRKVDRQIQLLGPSQYDAWLLIDFDPDVAWFCERPPIYIELLPLEGKRRPLDFWVWHRSGKQFGIVLHNVALARDKGCSIDLLKRSLEASRLKCEIWQGADMRSRAIYLRNLKELQPFVAMEQPSDDQLERALVAHLESVKTASWSELTTVFASRFEGVVNMVIARLIHSGRIRAELRNYVLASNTVLRLP